MNPGAIGLERLAGLPCDTEGPVFKEPWEAEAFAMAVHLSEAGRFTWGEWTAALAREIRSAGTAGDPDLGDTYYQHWLRALLALCAETGLVPADGLQRRTEEWRQAYLRTPHGRPVELAAGLEHRSASR